MSRPDQPNLTPEQIDDAIKMVGEGHRLATIAKKFRVTRQAFYMRKARSDGQPDGFAEKVASAEADAEILYLTKLVEAERDWQKFAWILERRFGWLSAVDRAKIKALHDAVPRDDQAVESAQSIAMWKAARATLPTAPVSAPPSAPDAPVAAPAGTVAEP